MAIDLKPPPGGSNITDPATWAGGTRGAFKAPFLSPFVLLGTSYLGGMAKRRAARESAKAETDNAIEALIEGRFQERSQRGEQTALLSLIRNRAAGAGVDLSQGSPLEAFLQTARETELDILSAKHAAESEAAARFNRAKLLRRQGNDELFGSLLSGGADVLAFGTKRDSASYKGSGD